MWPLFKTVHNTSCKVTSVDAVRIVVASKRLRKLEASFWSLTAVFQTLKGSSHKRHYETWYRSRNDTECN